MPCDDAQAVLLGQDALGLLVHDADGPGLVDDHDADQETVEREGRLVEGVDGASLRGLEDFLPGFLGALHGARLDPGDLIETRGDGREQDLVIDRLDEIIVRAGLLADQNVVPLGQGRQEDERHVGHGRPARAWP